MENFIALVARRNQTGGTVRLLVISGTFRYCVCFCGTDASSTGGTVGDFCTLFYFALVALVRTGGSVGELAFAEQLQPWSLSMSTCTRRCTFCCSLCAMCSTLCICAQKFCAFHWQYLLHKCALHDTALCTGQCADFVH